MRGPEHVLAKAKTRYRSVWRDALLGADPGVYSVPLDPPSATEVTTRAGDVSAWLAHWRQWAAQHPGVTLRTRTMRTKFGDQPVHTHLDIPGTAALADLNPGTASHWQRARTRWDQLRYHQPGQAVLPWLARIVDLDTYDFTTLLAATTWFRANPRSGLTVRSVPVPGMHTKWLARHRSMVLACLGTSTASSQSPEETGDSDPADIPTGDLDALGLRPLPREISIVLADPALRPAVGGLRQITAPVDEFARLPIHPDTVLIVENKEPALAWSDATGLVIIHSLGNHLDVLSGLPWIPHDGCWYWGDLDRHGFTLLSRAVPASALPGATHRSRWFLRMRIASGSVTGRELGRPGMLTEFGGLSTPLVADACIRVGVPLRVAPPGIGAVVPGQRVAGRALPTRHYGSVDVFLEAFSGAAHGDVLVVDNGGREDEACVGDLVVLEAQAVGVGGVMVWGRHRDTAELTQIALPVFSYGRCPAGPVRFDQQEPSALASARFGACVVTRDDIVFGDDDGVVFVAASQAGEVLASARQIGEVERDQARKIQAGQTLRQQTAFSEYLARREAEPSHTFRRHLRRIGGAIEE